jgi:hypothetical protein
LELAYVAQWLANQEPGAVAADKLLATANSAMSILFAQLAKAD